MSERNQSNEMAAVGTNEHPFKEVGRLREHLRNDTMAYIKAIQPVLPKFVSTVSEHLDFYDTLNYENWCKMLPNILQVVKGYKEQCGTILQMHEDVLTSFKERHQEALHLVDKFKERQLEYQETKKMLEEKAEKKKTLAFGVGLVPYIGVIAGPLLDSSADSDTENAVVQGQQAQTYELASRIVSEALIPPLEIVIDDLTNTAGFFSQLKVECMMFENKGLNAVVNPNKLAWEVMKCMGKNMKTTCQIFPPVLPDGRTYNSFFPPIQFFQPRYISQ